ncbi:autotransporter outer membrane beta-barrel domain-containing protein [Mesorhizobium carmichaelinearum]|uniref:autotransporter outer membrane beta-barrel domain-containing protein n=1 Tax=Mesorhizobium carmichaelinearum TaxID=1208188 RepID=UPI0015C950F2|nr:autotransporter domain-containing protein [Mesorhizobium carmichaelinearum]
MRHSVCAARAKGDGEVNARLAGSLLSSTSLPALLIAGLIAAAVTPIMSGVASAEDFAHNSGDWGTAANWTPATVPNGTDAVANFNHDAPDQGLGYTVFLTGGPYTVGTLNLNATSTSGGYRFSNGVLNFQASGQAAINVQTNNFIPDLDAGGSFNLISDTVFTVAAGAHFTADGTISGAGLTKSGDGLLTLNGANTYTGGTNLYGGTLSLGNNNALGTGPLSAFGGTTIDIQSGVSIANDLLVNSSPTIQVGSGTATYTGLISDYDEASAIIKTGAGTLVLTNNGNSFGSGAMIKAGTIQVTADHALGSGPITLDGGTLQAGANLTVANVSILFGAAGGTIDTNGFDVSTSASMGDDSTPSGTFTKTGAGTLTVEGFAGNNTYATATDVAQGTLKAGLFAANIFSANSAYTIESGATLDLNNFDQAIGSLAGAGAVNAGTGKLTTGGNNGSTVFSGVITGTNGLIKDGTGTFELSGSNALSGGTEVKAGTLLVSGSLIGSAVTVDSGATLGGTGSVGPIAVSGTVAPGKNGIGTLAVYGDASFASGSTYAVELNSAGAADLIVAVGTASIAPGAGLSVTNIGPDSLVAGAHYVVLQAVSVGGTFTLIGDPQVSAFARLSTHSITTQVYVDVTQTKTFGSAGVTPNQIATGDGLESAGSSALVSAVLGLPSDAAAQAAFDQLSGEIHASAKGMLLQDSHLLQDAVTARLRGAFGDSGKTASLPVMAYGEDGVQPVAADTDRFAIWSQGFGSWGSTDSDGNAAAFDRSTGGLLVGADGLAGNWRIGVVGGYSRTSFDADDRNSSGDSDNYHLGLYGGTNWGAVAFRTGAAYTWHRISTSRSVAFQGFTDSLSADYDAATAQAFGELAYKTDAGPFAFEPFANLAYVNLDTDGFAESGGAAALTSGSSTSDATFTTLGVRASTDITLGGVAATARGMLGWRHAFGDVTPLSTVAFAGGDSFTIAGVPIARDTMLVEAGFDVQLARNATLGLSYAGQFGADAFDNGFKANLGIKF